LLTIDINPPLRSASLPPYLHNSYLPLPPNSPTSGRRWKQAYCNPPFQHLRTPRSVNSVSTAYCIIDSLTHLHPFPVFLSSSMSYYPKDST
jgi:hypothetical protein